MFTSLEYKGYKTEWFENCLDSPHDFDSLKCPPSVPMGNESSASLPNSWNTASTSGSTPGRSSTISLGKPCSTDWLFSSNLYQVKEIQLNVEHSVMLPLQIVLKQGKQVWNMFMTTRLSLSCTISLAQKPTFSPGTRVSCYSTEVSLRMSEVKSLSLTQNLNAFLPQMHEACIHKRWEVSNHLAKKLLVLYHICPVDLVSTAWHTWASYDGLVSGPQVASPDILCCLDLWPGAEPFWEAFILSKKSSKLSSS